MTFEENINKAAQEQYGGSTTLFWAQLALLALKCLAKIAQCLIDWSYESPEG